MEVTGMYERPTAVLIAPTSRVFKGGSPFLGFHGKNIETISRDVRGRRK